MIDEIVNENTNILILCNSIFHFPPLLSKNRISIPGYAPRNIIKKKKKTRSLKRRSLFFSNNTVTFFSDQLFSYVD